MKKANCILAVLLMLAGYAYAQSSAVTAAFQSRFPQVDQLEWEQEKKGLWEAGFKSADGKEMSATFTAAGQWVETETAITFAQLPAPVQAALKGKKVRETARIEQAQGRIIYEAEVGHRDRLYDATGQRVKL